jgi:hypothetical protein
MQQELGKVRIRKTMILLYQTNIRMDERLYHHGTQR